MSRERREFGRSAEIGGVFGTEPLTTYGRASGVVVDGWSTSGAADAPAWVDAERNAALPTKRRQKP